MDKDRDREDRIDERIIPHTARACRGCRKVMPNHRFPNPLAKQPLCHSCTLLWMLYRERPTTKWIRFPCTGCDAIVRAPRKAKSARAMLCVPCYDGWRAFSDEVERRRKRGELS